MSHVNCPYCNCVNEINRDGDQYDEDSMYEHQCPHCDNYFVFTTTINISYNAYKVDCLNGSTHDYVLTNTFPREYTEHRCTMCDHRKPLT